MKKQPTNRETLITQHIVQYGMIKLAPRKNKAFSNYLYSSRKAASLARGASMRKTGKGTRTTFDLKLQEQNDKAGEGEK